MGSLTDPIVAAPCAKCPFRMDIPIYLRADRRREIAQALMNDQTFSCHQQVDYSQEDDEGWTVPDPTGAAMCAGAAKSLMLAGSSTNLMRVMARLGAWDPDKAETTGAAVWELSKWQKLPEGATAATDLSDMLDGDDDDIEPCGTVNEGCLAPAGYATGGGVVRGSESTDDYCSECGDPCCSNCLSESGLCGFCAEYEDDI